MCEVFYSSGGALHKHTHREQRPRAAEPTGLSTHLLSMSPQKNSNRPRKKTRNNFGSKPGKKEGRGWDVRTKTQFPLRGRFPSQERSSPAGPQSTSWPGHGRAGPSGAAAMEQTYVGKGQHGTWCQPPAAQPSGRFYCCRDQRQCWCRSASPSGRRTRRSTR